MAEIRSTIEIMMERTKGMSLSEEEKKAFKREELQKKAKGLYLKLTQTPALVDSLLDGIRESDEPDDKMLRAMLWNIFVENLPSGKDMDSFLELMRKIPASPDRLSLLSDLQKELKVHQKGRMKQRKVELEAERKRLAAAGISGTAVSPKLRNDHDGTTNIIDKYKKILILDMN
ncbi:MAG: hypothetical protein ACP5M0_12350 [Desulfomonilaceae bacterium]